MYVCKVKSVCVCVYVMCLSEQVLAFLLKAWSELGAYQVCASYITMVTVLWNENGNNFLL